MARYAHYRTPMVQWKRVPTRLVPKIKAALEAENMKASSYVNDGDETAIHYDIKSDVLLVIQHVLAEDMAVAAS